MSGKLLLHGTGNAGEMHNAWLSPAKLMPSPPTTQHKAALALTLDMPLTGKSLVKTRIALGGAAIAIAVAVPSLSLEAMVGKVGGSYFGIATSEPEIAPMPLEPNADLATQIWMPAEQVAGPVYAQTLAVQAAVADFSSETRLNAFDREMPVTLVETPSETFDLAFAGVEAPTPLTALVASSLPKTDVTLSSERALGVSTGTIAIDQITDLDLVVRATPENVRASEQVLGVGASSARTDAIANRSVEAAFAGAIDASSAVRNSLPITSQPQQNTAPNIPQTRPTEERSAFAIGAPSAEVSASAASQAVLVPKAKLDARINGVLTGSVDFKQLDGTIALRLRSVAHMMRGTFSQAEFSDIMKGQSIDNYVPIAELQAAGIPISYSPAYDEVEFGIDYKDAPNAKKVQIDQISVAPIGSELTAIEQIPR